MKVLALDIETKPANVYVWGIWNVDVNLHAVVDTGGVICFAAKFLDQKKMHFYSVFKDGHDEMIRAAHELLDQADVVLTYNGKKFDVPHLNREFLEMGLSPPAPYQQIDLYVASKKFKFLSHKLAHISTKLGLEGKVAHEGFKLWLDCMDGDAKAWAKMEKYNKRDVTLLQELYDIMLPWIPNHPSRALYDGHEGCPRCGGQNLKPRGFSYTKVSTFQRYKCADCGGWSRGTGRLDSCGITESLL